MSDLPPGPVLELRGNTGRRDGRGIAAGQVLPPSGNAHAIVAPGDIFERVNRAKLQRGVVVAQGEREGAGRFGRIFEFAQFCRRRQANIEIGFITQHFGERIEGLFVAAAAERLRSRDADIAIGVLRGGNDRVIDRFHAHTTKQRYDFRSQKTGGLVPIALHEFVGERALTINRHGRDFPLHLLEIPYFRMERGTAFLILLPFLAHPRVPGPTAIERTIGAARA